MKLIPAFVVVITSIALIFIINFRQEKMQAAEAVIQYNVPYIARNRIELRDANQLVLIDANGNILIK